MKRSSDHQLTKEDDNEGAQGSVGSVAFYFPRASNEEMQQRRILHVQQQQNSSVHGTTGPVSTVALILLANKAVTKYQEASQTPDECTPPQQSRVVSDCAVEPSANLTQPTIRRSPRKHDNNPRRSPRHNRRIPERFRNGQAVAVVNDGVKQEKTKLQQFSLDRNFRSYPNTCTIATPSTVPSGTTLYSLSEFMDMLQIAARNAGAVNLLALEETDLVKSANSKMSKDDTNYQERAQYGRVMEQAVDRLLREVLCVQPNETFLDIGHGIGTLVLQAAYTIGCEARGIEVVEDRNALARALLVDLEHQRLKFHQLRDGRSMKVGMCKLERGELQDPRHRRFLTNRKRVTKAFVNNFNGVFADRSAKKSHMYYLDDFVSGLFASMKEGSVLVTLYPLTLAPSMHEANALRKLHGMLPVENASYYSMEILSLGPANQVVSWSYGGGCTNDVKLYKYVRVGNPEFVCSNPSCTKARSGTKLDATREVFLGNVGYLVVNSCCSNRTLRKSRKETVRYAAWQE
jgi:hypothetical protein